MQISFVFWVVTFGMATAAVLFVLLPVAARKSRLSNSWWLLAFIFPVFVAALYGYIGRPDASGYSSVSSEIGFPSAHSSQSPDKNLGSVASMVDGLRERLRDNPNDADGWILLAKSYDHLQMPKEARLAYAEADRLGVARRAVASVRGRISIADGAKISLAPTDSVFIFAKSVDGPAMPVAAIRKQVADLPLEFELTDADAMTAAAKLSTSGRVTVSARISKSGNAMRADPGFDIVSEPVDVVDGTFVELKFDAT